jgi:hypothetical protein
LSCHGFRSFEKEENSQCPESEVRQTPQPALVRTSDSKGHWKMTIPVWFWVGNSLLNQPQRRENFRPTTLVNLPYPGLASNCHGESIMIDVLTA